MFRRCFTLSLASIAVCAAALHFMADTEETRAIVERARISFFDDVVATKDFESLRCVLASAWGVLIFPSILKGGLVIREPLRPLEDDGGAFMSALSVRGVTQLRNPRS
jgi:hypothetical protein